MGAPVLLNDSVGDLDDGLVVVCGGSTKKTLGLFGRAAFVHHEQARGDAPNDPMQDGSIESTLGPANDGADTPTMVQATTAAKAIFFMTNAIDSAVSSKGPDRAVDCSRDRQTTLFSAEGDDRRSTIRCAKSRSFTFSRCDA